MRQWFWFAGLYLAGIAVIGTIALVIRSALL